MKSVKSIFRRSTDVDDPGSIESIERASEKNSRQKQKAACRPPTLRDIPRLTREMLMQNSKSKSLKEAQEKAIHAAKTLYELCDVGHKSNREPMVASGQYDVIGPLTQCLLHEPIYFHDDHYSTSTSSMELSSSSSASASLAAKLTEAQQEPRINDDNDDGPNGDNSEENTDDAEKQDPGEAADSTEDGSVVAEPITPSADDMEDAPPPMLPEQQTKTSSSSARRKVRRHHHRVDQKLHFVCLTLNNLSIPNDNKRVMVRERGAKRLIGNLCKVIKSGKKEAHLCCIILMNLSFYEPGLTIIGQFSPTKLSPIMPSSPSSSAKPENPSSPNNQENNSDAAIDNTSNHKNTSNGSINPNKAAKAGAKALATTTTVLKRAAAVVSKPRKLTPLENPDSLLRILQDLVSTAERGTSDFRWAFGLLANLSRHPENALLIGLTGIPRVAIENLRRAKTPSSEWATHSLEDFSLYFLLHLTEACPSDSLKGALDVAMKIMNNSEDHYCAIENGTNHDGAENGENRNRDNHDDDNNNSKDDTANFSSPHNDNRHRSGIQNLKATMICAFLGLEWKEFPDHGVIAAGAVSELMGNTFERVGKKATYTDSDFSLRTAVNAYAALAKAAARADQIEATRSLATAEAKINKNTLTAATAATTSAPKRATNGSSGSSSSCVHTKVMALPTSVCMLFKIINAIALHWSEDNHSIGVGSQHSSGSNHNSNEFYSDTYHWDIKAGDLAVGAVMSLLPALLEGTGEPSMGSQQACADLSKMFVFFSKKTNSIAVRARSLEVAEKLTKSASGSALPLLEASYDLCRNFGIHRLQKNFL